MDEGDTAEHRPRCRLHAAIDVLPLTRETMPMLVEGRRPGLESAGYLILAHLLAAEAAEKPL